jgi:hypothetical protein
MANSYPSNPVVVAVPSETPRQSNGRKFTSSSDEAESNTSANGTESSVDELDDPDHYVPGCGDKLMSSALVVPVDTGQSSCQDKTASSPVPRDVFSGEDTGVYGQFCFQFNPEEQSEWTVDSTGKPIPQSGQGVKRASPSNPSRYEDFQFHLKWTPDTTASTACRQTVGDCLRAFKLVSDSCGHQGDEGTLMALTGKFSIPNCGAYSYGITGFETPSSPSSPPSEPSSTSTPLPSIKLGSQWCYPASNDHEDVHDQDQDRGAASACMDTDGKMVVDGDPSTNLHITTYAQNGDLPYKYNVFWTPNCKSSVTQMDIGNPLGGGPHTCYELLRNDYKNCELNPFEARRYSYLHD